MGYSIREAKGERAAAIRKAVDEQDCILIRHFAALEQAEGNDEYAAALQQLARRTERDEWAYDEAKDNELQDNLY